MANLSIVACILTAMLFALTRKTYVKIIKNDTLHVEIHFTIIALCFTKRKEEKEKDGNNRRENKKNYIRIFSKILEIVDHCEIEVNSLLIPQNEKTFSVSTTTAPYRYHALLSALIAYIATKAQKLTICDNAIRLIYDDSASLQFNITLKLFTHNLIRDLIIFLSKNRKSKLRKKVG